MTEVLIYTTPICPYCVMAKRLLDSKGIKYSEVNVAQDLQLREEMITKSNRRTVPQIFIGGFHVGGFDELYALDKEKKLDKLLQDETSV